VSLAEPVCADRRIVSIGASELNATRFVCVSGTFGLGCPWSEMMTLGASRCVLANIATTVFEKLA
jgi:hypothetical protein